MIPWLSQVIGHLRAFPAGGRMQCSFERSLVSKLVLSAVSSVRCRVSVAPSKWRRRVLFVFSCRPSPCRTVPRRALRRRGAGSRAGPGRAGAHLLDRLQILMGEAEQALAVAAVRDLAATRRPDEPVTGERRQLGGFLRCVEEPFHRDLAAWRAQHESTLTHLNALRSLITRFNQLLRVATQQCHRSPTPGAPKTR